MLISWLLPWISIDLWLLSRSTSYADLLGEIGKRPGLFLDGIGREPGILLLLVPLVTTILAGVAGGIRAPKASSIVTVVAGGIGLVASLVLFQQLSSVRGLGTSGASVLGSGFAIYLLGSIAAVVLGGLGLARRT
jgi:hypothetical protein